MRSACCCWPAVPAIHRSTSRPAKKSSISARIQPTVDTADTPAGTARAAWTGRARASLRTRPCAAIARTCPATPSTAEPAPRYVNRRHRRANRANACAKASCAASCAWIRRVHKRSASAAEQRAHVRTDRWASASRPRAVRPRRNASEVRSRARCSIMRAQRATGKPGAIARLELGCARGARPARRSLGFSASRRQGARKSTSVRARRPRARRWPLTSARRSPGVCGSYRPSDLIWGAARG